MLQVLPHDNDMERSVIGAMLMDNHAYNTACDMLNEDCFYSPDTKVCFRALHSVRNMGKYVDLLALFELLKRADDVDNAGGMYNVSKMMDNVRGVGAIEVHCLMLKEKFVKRSLITLGHKLVALNNDASTDVFDNVFDAERAIYELSVGNVKSNYANADTLVVDALKRIGHLSENPTDLTGVPTGYSYLDNLTHGWQDTDLVIVAARPSVGKTAFALNLCINAAMDLLKPVNVGFFSLEMSSRQLVERMLSMVGKVPLEGIKSGRLSDAEKDRLYKAADNISKLTFVIDDSAAMTTQHIRSSARRMKLKNNVGLIVVDYLQLITGSGNRNMNREQEVTQISKALKAVAKELCIPVIALCQMSRAVEQRAGKEPTLSDLRESGSIEQDADIVGFLTRDDYMDTAGDAANNAYLKIRKHRNGRCDDVTFKTDLSVQRFYDTAQWKTSNPF